MTVAELQRALAGANPDAEVIVTYHISEHEDAGFYEDDVVTANSYANHKPGTVHLLTEGYYEAVYKLEKKL